MGKIQEIDVPGSVIELSWYKSSTQTHEKTYLAYRNTFKYLYAFVNGHSETSIFHVKASNSHQIILGEFTAQTFWGNLRAVLFAIAKTDNSTLCASEAFSVKG